MTGALLNPDPKKDAGQSYKNGLAYLGLCDSLPDSISPLVPFQLSGAGWGVRPRPEERRKRVGHHGGHSVGTVLEGLPRSWSSLRS